MVRHGNNSIKDGKNGKDARNLRLGLATDGLNPFGNMDNS
jgi:hypothetical protein